MDRVIAVSHAASNVMDNCHSGAAKYDGSLHWEWGEVIVRCSDGIRPSP